MQPSQTSQSTSLPLTLVTRDHEGTQNEARELIPGPTETPAPDVERRHARKWKKPAIAAIEAALQGGSLQVDAPIEDYYRIAALAYLDALTKASPASRILYPLVHTQLGLTALAVASLDKEMGRERRSRAGESDPNPILAPVEALFDRYAEFFPGSARQGLATRFWQPVTAAAGLRRKEDVTTDEEVVLMTKQAKVMIFDLAEAAAKP